MNQQEPQGRCATCNHMADGYDSRKRVVLLCLREETAAETNHEQTCEHWKPREANQ